MKIDVRENIIEKYTRLPHLGQRIIKSAVAVFFCLLIYMLRDYKGLVTQSTVAAIICIQPYRSDGIEASANRIIGTLVGAGWGLLFLISADYLTSHSIHFPMLIIYMIMSAGIVVTLYTTVFLKKTDAASLSAIVFICIVGTYPDLEMPFILTRDRIIDTFIGILVAGLVNSINLPRQKHPEYLFFIRLQDLVPDRYSHISPNILVMLNRLYNDGTRICLVSKWAPAFLLSQMGFIDIDIPVIVMDGAGLYDIPERQYLDIISIPPADVYYLKNIFNGMNLGYCIYAIKDSSLMIYRQGFMNEAEDQDYEIMKRSPYRNYVDGNFDLNDQVAFIRVIDTDNNIDDLELCIRELIPENKFRLVRRPQPKMKGYSGLYFYHPEATVEHMKEILLMRLSEKDNPGLVPVDMFMGERWTSDKEAIALLNKTRNVYEPVRIPHFKKK